MYIKIFLIVLIVVLILTNKEKFHNWRHIKHRNVPEYIFDETNYPIPSRRTGLPGSYFAGLHPYNNFYIGSRDYPLETHNDIHLMNL